MGGANIEHWWGDCAADSADSADAGGEKQLPGAV